LNVAILLFVASSAAVSYFLYRIILFNKLMYRQKAISEMVFADLENALGFVEEGLPVLQSVNLVSEQEADENARTRLSKLVAEHKLGMGHLTKEALENRLQLYREKEERARSVAEGTIQTYSTLRMFVAAVAPAFILFAFIGSQVLESASMSSWLFASLLLFLLPSVFALIGTIMNRRVYGTSE
jgi:hypothetical protein